MPKLRYPCGGQPNEWGEKILTLPARLAAIKVLEAQLASFISPAWWSAETEDLNLCDLRHQTGPLSLEEKRRYEVGEYGFWLFGDNHVRLVLIPDPCYQTEYNGSNAFLLYRKDGKVFVSQVLDGYFSRADKSVNIAFAKLHKPEIIEVSTSTGGLNPDIINYYFVIDPKTNKAVPKNLFDGSHGPTNKIRSAMLFSAPQDLNLPADASPLNIIRGHVVAKSFSVYAEDPDGKINDNERTYSRTVLNWNGKLYR